MKKVLSSIASLGCVVAAMSPAISYADAAGAAADSGDVAKCNCTLKLTSRYAIVDSGTESNFYFLDQVARLGGKVKMGRLSGKLMVGFNGNHINTSPGFNNTQTSTPGDNGGVSASSNATAGNQVTIREAWLAYNLFEKDGHSVSAKLGRFIPGGASSYGADPTVDYWAATGNISYNDGVAAEYAGSFGKVDLAVQAAYTNALVVYAFETDASVGTSTIGKLDSVWGGTGETPNNKSHALILDAQVSASVNDDVRVEAGAAWGHKANSRLANGTGANGTYRATLDYMEFSAGVGFKSLVGGIWYSKLAASKFEYLSSNKTDSHAGVTASNASTDSATRGTSKTFSAYGIGANGDGTMFGIKGLVAKNDTVVYGVGFQKTSVRGNENTNANDPKVGDSSNNDTTMYSAGGGYQNGPFQFTLNWATFTAKNAVFKYRDQAASSTSSGSSEVGTTTSHKVYLMAGISL